MKSIAMLGSEEQKQTWLPAMARLEKLGAFALTEPDHGSDSVALETTARREGDHFVIDGAKRWIGNGSLADVVVVWARGDDGKVSGFLLERDARLQRPGDRGEGLATGNLAGSDHARRRPRAGAKPIAGRELVQGHRPSPRRHPRHVRLGGARPRGRGVRRGPDLRDAAPTVRQASGQLPDRSGSSGEDARRGDQHAALLSADRAARPARPVDRHDRWAREAEQHPQGARDSAPRRATFSAATAFCSRTTSSATWPTSRRFTPTRGPKRCRCLSSGVTSPAWVRSRRARRGHAIAVARGGIRQAPLVGWPPLSRQATGILASALAVVAFGHERRREPRRSSEPVLGRPA